MVCRQKTLDFFYYWYSCPIIGDHGAFFFSSVLITLYNVSSYLVVTESLTYLPTYMIMENTWPRICSIKLTRARYRIKFPSEKLGGNFIFDYDFPFWGEIFCFEERFSVLKKDFPFLSGMLHFLHHVKSPQIELHQILGRKVVECHLRVPYFGKVLPYTNYIPYLLLYHTHKVT